MATRNPVAADQATAYALDVVNGGVVAGYLVRLACQRHLDDLRNGPARGLVWRPDQAQRVIEFFAEVLVLPERSEASEIVALAPAEETAAPQPFVLEPWQTFIVGSMFGWYTVQGFRRFREGYFEIARGSGKTPMCAGMMLYLLVADGQRAAQCFMAAVGRDQAGIAFADAVKMVKASPALKELIDERASALLVPADQSFLKPVSSEKRGLDGKRVHGACIDELHEHPTPVVLNKMRSSVKGMRNAMILEPTNSGFDRASVCWHQHEYGRKVLEGAVSRESSDPSFFFIAGLDPCATCRDEGKWFPDEGCSTCDDWRTEGPHWLKPNPNLGVSLPWQYLRERVNKAKDMPSEVSDVLRFNFCVWTQGSSRAIPMAKWAACQPLPSEKELIGAPCFGCLDLGETDDVSAWGRLWALTDGRVAVKLTYFLPSEALQRFPNRPYPAWQRAGKLIVTDGPVTDYAIVREHIENDYKALGMQAVFYDTKTARETAQILTGVGVTMIATAQGFGLHEAIKKTLELIVAGLLCHGDDPVLTYMASNTVVVEGAKKEKRLAKERSPEKIDGISAVVMGVEGAIVRRERRAAPQLIIIGAGR